MSYSKGALLLKKLYSTVSTMSSNNVKNGHLYIVEPLCAMVRIALLNYRPIGTKISISNNKISYSDPTVLQGTIRWSYGDTRNDLHYLLNPIKKAVLWFDPTKSPNTRIIFKIAMKGLRKLKETYKNTSEGHLVCHSIDLYISIINDCLKGKRKKMDVIIEDDNAICKALRHIWLDSQVELIGKLLLQIEEDRGHTCHYLDAIENILKVIEGRVNSVVINLHSYESDDSVEGEDV